MSTLNSGEMTLDEFQQKAINLERLEKENWEKHFKEHPEQLLPGATIRRPVNLEEADLFGELLWRCPAQQ